MRNPELIIFLRLFVAHILADFFLQRYRWIVDKRMGTRSPYLYYHVVIVGLLSYLFLGDWEHWQLPLFIASTHFLIDWWKSTQPRVTRTFLLDQLLHILALVAGWLFYIGYDMETTFAWVSGLNTAAFWVVAGSYLLVLRPLGFLIEKATRRWQEELESVPTTFNGLRDAGTWIGYMERVIILTFLLLGQFSAIGFLIAAKSIFRYSGKVDDETGHKQAEYILIGTLMSFLLAIAVGIGTRYILGL